MTLVKCREFLHFSFGISYLTSLSSAVFFGLTRIISGFAFFFYLGPILAFLPRDLS
jgi:hypothetical protein